MVKETKKMTGKMTAQGISSYYVSVPRGEKGAFLMEVATAIGQTVSSVQHKISDGRWSKLELNAIKSLIDGRRM